MLYYSELLGKALKDKNLALFNSEEELFKAEQAYNDGLEEKKLKDDAEKLEVDQAFDAYIAAKDFSAALTKEAAEMQKRANKLSENAASLIKESRAVTKEAYDDFNRVCNKYLKTHKVYEYEYNDGDRKESIKRTGYMNTGKDWYNPFWGLFD